jgi:hypothetical protein
MDGEPDLLGAEPAAVRLEPGVKENTVTAFSAVRAGIRQVMAARRLWLTYYVATLGFGIAAALPLALLIGSSLGGTTWPARMNGQFDLDWLFEFVYRSGDAASTTFGPVVLALGAGYLLLATFLSGGAIAHFASGAERYDAGAFWGACGRNFGRLLRLLVYTFGCPHCTCSFNFFGSI